MLKKIYVSLQNLLPQHFLSRTLGNMADSSNPRLKNFLIRQFMKHYRIDLREAEIENPEQFPTFNSFFIRKLKPELRPIVSGAQNIASPVDGTIAAMGEIRENLLLQAKDFYFDLESLIGGNQTLAQRFYHGQFATLYLAPHNYHRVHMPLDGQLEKTIFIPGKLFSVNRVTSDYVPHLFSRNERLVSIFNTEAGRVAIILVGAMIVGSIQTSWMHEPMRYNEIKMRTFPNGPILKKGAELGHFKLGSTVILLFEPNRVSLNNELPVGDCIKLGQKFGEILF